MTAVAQTSDLSSAQTPALTAVEESQQPNTSVNAAPTGSLFGTVEDPNHLIVPNAQVRLENLDNHKVQTASSDDQGAFNFLNLVAGHYKIVITSKGMGIFTESIELKSGEPQIIPNIALPIAVTKSEVLVYANKDEIAQEELHIAEQQRIFGVFPNFYIAYDWNAPAMTTKQKYVLAARSIYDPVNLALTGVVAGLQQAQNTYPAYGQGGAGFGKYFGAAFATGSIDNMLGGAVFPQLFHQDPRYFYKGTGSVKSRMWYAIYEAVLCRGDNGKQQFNYSGILGSLAAGAISNAYYPPSDRGVSLTFEDTLIGTAASAAANIVQEFLLKHVTAHSKDRPAAVQ